MRLKFPLALLIVVFLVGCGESRNDHPLVDDDDVILVLVDGQPVTLPMLEFMMASRGLSEDDHEGMRELLEELIRLQAVANAARAEGLDREPQVRARRILRDLEVLQLRYFDYVYHEHPPTDEDIADVYQAQVERAGGLQYQIETLIFPSQAEALTALAQIDEGEASFEDLAEASRAAGEALDAPFWISASQVPEDVSGLLESSEIGETIGLPLQTPSGWRVLRVADTRAADVPELDEVREGIARHLVRQRLEALVEDLYERSEIIPMLPLEDVE